MGRSQSTDKFSVVNRKSRLVSKLNKISQNDISNRCELDDEEWDKYPTWDESNED